MRKRRGRSIVFAVPSTRWPRRANVVVALVAIAKTQWQGACELEGRSVKSITGGLREPAEDDVQISPGKLKQNTGIVFIGTYVNETGVFLDRSAAKILLAKNPGLAEVIRRHTNGDDLYGHVEQRGSRYVIDFGERSIEEARKLEDCFEIVEATSPKTTESATPSTPMLDEKSSNASFFSTTNAMPRKSQLANTVR